MPLRNDLERVDDGDTEEESEVPVRRIVRAVRMPNPIDLGLESDGLSHDTRKKMVAYMDGTNVLHAVKKAKLIHLDDPEAVSWGKELELEKTQNMMAADMRDEVLKGLKEEGRFFEFTRDERLYVNKVIEFASSANTTVSSLSRSVYEKGKRGVLAMERKTDDFACFDRKLERRDLRNDKLQKDKVVGVAIMREIHTKLVNVKTDLVAANVKTDMVAALSEKREETLKSVTAKLVSVNADMSTKKVKTDLVAVLSEKRAQTLKGILGMVYQARCVSCHGEIIEGHMMKCKNTVCSVCVSDHKCCDSVYPLTRDGYMKDMVWMMDLIDTSILEGAVDDTDVKKAIKDYMDEEFELRSVLHRVSLSI
jgi:hypothetical protein